MSEFSLKIIFPESRSKNYKQALDLAYKFENYESGKLNIIDVKIKEVFEKWEYFNLLFWRTVDWNGTIIEWEGMKFNSHSDKTRIFYALQHAHDGYINFLEAKIKELYRVKLGELSFDDLDSFVYTDSDTDLMIETFEILKIKKDVNEDSSYRSFKIKEQPWFLRYPKKLS